MVIAKLGRALGKAGSRRNNADGGLFVLETCQPIRPGTHVSPPLAAYVAVKGALADKGPEFAGETRRRHGCNNGGIRRNRRSFTGILGKCP